MKRLTDESRAEASPLTEQAAHPPRLPQQSRRVGLRTPANPRPPRPPSVGDVPERVLQAPDVGRGRWAIARGPDPSAVTTAATPPQGRGALPPGSTEQRDSGVRSASWRPQVISGTELAGLGPRGAQTWLPLCRTGAHGVGRAGRGPPLCTQTAPSSSDVCVCTSSLTLLCLL